MQSECEIHRFGVLEPIFQVLQEQTLHVIVPVIVLLGFVVQLITDYGRVVCRDFDHFADHTFRII